MVTATLIKHSERTNRRPCRACGKGGTDDKSVEFYWFHDTSKPADATARKYCREHNSNSWILTERDGTPHEARCTGKAAKPASDASLADLRAKLASPASNLMPTTAPAQAPVSVPDAPLAPVPAPVNGAAPDRASAIQALLELLAPKVDAAQVNEIIDNRLRSIDSLAIPFRVEVVKPNGDVKTVKGMAHAVLPRLIRIVGNARKHVFMVGMAGSGKSTLGEQVAEALDLEFSSMSVGPTTSGTEIKGYMNSGGTYVTTEFRKRFELGGIMLLDEVDAGNPGIFTMINAALANGQMAFPDGMVTKHPDFRCMAAGNTFGRGPDRMYVGRQQMDYATLDRFIVVTVDIDEKLETAMCYGTGLVKSTVDAVLTYTRALRENVISQRLAVLVTPRASQGVCALLAAGDSRSEAIDGAIRKGLSNSDWASVTRGVSPVGF